MPREPAPGIIRRWAALYGIIWVVLLEFLLALVPNAGPIVLDLHAALGFLIVVFASVNFRGLRATPVPGRVKRIARSTFQLSIVLAILGLLLWVDLGSTWTIALGLTLWDFILFLHVVNSLAILTQAAAVAIAHDMGEDREYVKETRPSEVPPPTTVSLGPVPPRS